jgi:hypothetical protein
MLGLRSKPVTIYYQHVAQTSVCATFAPQTEKSGLSCCVTRLSNSIEGQQLYAPALSVLFREDSVMTPSMGQWGARDFDKVAFNLPIPKFDRKKTLHCDLAAAAHEAEQIASTVPLNEGEHFTRVRKHIRDALSNAGISARIDDMVAELLGAA